MNYRLPFYRFTVCSGGVQGRSPCSRPKSRGKRGDKEVMLVKQRLVAALFTILISVTAPAAWAQVQIVSPRKGERLTAGQVVRVDARLAAASSEQPTYLTAVVTDPDGIAEVAGLRDDGRAADETAGDGLWSGLYRGGEKAGAYRVQVKALVGSETTWSSAVTFLLEPAPPPPPAPAPRRWPIVVLAICSLGAGIAAGAALRRRPQPVAPPPNEDLLRDLLREMSTLRDERDRLAAETRGLRERLEASAGAPAVDGTEVATLRDRVAEAEARLAQMQREYERLDRERQAAGEREASHALANLFDDLAGPLSQLEAARARVEGGGKMQAADLLRLVRPLRQALEQRGLTAVGAVGEHTAFDHACHQPLGEQTFQEGEPVTIRFPGFLHGERIVRKALVSREGA